MTAPDHERAVAPGSRGNSTGPHAPLRRIVRLIFFLTLGLVLFLALIPNRGLWRFHFVPRQIQRWIMTHDDLNNILAFAVLGTAAFLVRKHRRDREAGGILGAVARTFASQWSRMAGLLVMVCGLEILQRWIPGRVSELEDVCTGFSGIFSAWLVRVLLDARGRDSRPEPPSTH